MARYYDTIRYKLIVFGDGHLATLIDQDKPYFDRLLKLTMVRLLIVPTPELIQQYNIPSQKLTENTTEGMGLWVEYPQMYIHHLTHSQTFGVVDVDVTFDGQDTERTERNKKLYSRIQVLEQQVYDHEVTIFVLTEKNEELMTHKMEYLKSMKEMQQVIGEKSVVDTGDDNYGK